MVIGSGALALHTLNGKGLGVQLTTIKLPVPDLISVFVSVKSHKETISSLLFSHLNFEQYLKIYLF
jgi:hypothetical protein